MTIICVQQNFDMRHDDAGNGFSKNNTYYNIYRHIYLMVSVMNELDNRHLTVSITVFFFTFLNKSEHYFGFVLIICDICMVNIYKKCVYW